MLSEETLMRHLNSLLSSSEQGDMIHHLHVVSAPADAVGPLGTIDEAKIHSAVYAIVPTGDVDPEMFTAQVIVMAGVEEVKRNARVLFAGLSQEMVTVSDGDDLARDLRRRGKLSEHPRAVEATVLYAAARDGRRWRGIRWLTGERAGTTDKVDIIVGKVTPQEGSGVRAAELVRRLVGIDMVGVR